MILLDERYLAKSSSRYIGFFNGLGVSAFLEYGDAVFWDKANAHLITVEVKRALDLLICIERTGRLGEQIRKAREVGGEYYLVLHGFKYVGPDEQGDVATWTRNGWQKVLLPDTRSSGHPMPYRRMDNYLNTLSTIDRVVVKPTRDERETAEVIKDLYWWWQKSPEDHTSQTAEMSYTPIYLPSGKVGLVRRWAKELGGIGMGRSKAVEQRFKSAIEMAEAGEREWREVEGIGEGLSRKIVREIRAERKEG